MSQITKRLFLPMMIFLIIFIGIYFSHNLVHFLIESAVIMTLLLIIRKRNRQIIELKNISLNSDSPPSSMNAVESHTSESAHVNGKNVNDSELLKEFRAGKVVYYQYGQFYNMEGEETIIPCKDQVIQLIRRNLDTNDAQHEFIEETTTGKTFNIHWIKVGGRIYLIIFDVSYLLEFEREQDAKIRKIYREVIHSVTQGKLFLLEMDELADYLEEPPLLVTAINKREDVAICRNEVGGLLAEISLTERKKFNLLLSVSEAVTNVLKHARGGEMKVFIKGNRFTVIVEDHGDGIQLHSIPKSALFNGYSTKKSMGQGFGLMLKMMDQVSLFTSKEGTTVILELQLDEKAIAL